MRGAFVFFFPLLLLFAACGSPSTSSAADDVSVEQPPRGKEASRQDTVVESVYLEMRDMHFTDALAIPEFAQRILHPEWGHVTALLKAENPQFQAVGDSMISAQAAGTIEDSLVNGILMIDTKREVTFAAIFNPQSRSLRLWPEEDSTRIPVPLRAWMTKQNAPADW